MSLWFLKGQPYSNTLVPFCSNESSENKRMQDWRYCNKGQHRRNELLSEKRDLHMVMFGRAEFAGVKYGFRALGIVFTVPS